MEWIKCCDRLPRKDEDVGFTYDGKEIYDGVYYDHTHERWEKLAEYEIPVEGITHWMPLSLPEPPKE